MPAAFPSEPGAGLGAHETRADATGSAEGRPRLPRKEKGVAGEREWARVPRSGRAAPGGKPRALPADRGKFVVSPRKHRPPLGSGLHPDLIWETSVPLEGGRVTRCEAGARALPARSRGLGGRGLLVRCGKRRPGRSPARAQDRESRSRSGLRPALPGADFCVGPARTSRPLGAERRPRQRERSLRPPPPGPGTGAARGPRRPAGLPGRDQGPASAPRRRTTRERGGPASHPAPRPPAGPLPGARDGSEQQPGAPRPRARRGQGRRPGVERTAARAAPTLPSESGVEHSASPSRANEEVSHGNSTTYLRARNGGASLPAPLTPGARPQVRRAGERGVGRRSGLPGLHPEGHHSPPRPGTHPAAGRRPGRDSAVAPCPILGGTERGLCASAPVYTFTSF